MNRCCTPTGGPEIGEFANHRESAFGALIVLRATCRQRPLAARLRAVHLGIAILLFAALARVADAQAGVAIRSHTISIETAKPSGIPRNDRIWITVFQPDDATVVRRPAVVLLHPLGEWRNTLMIDFGRFAARRGMVAAVVQLPHHMRRLGPRDNPLRHYVSDDVERVHQAFSQAIADASAVREWLSTRNDVDANRIGVIGVSLGAIVAHTAMGVDGRFSGGVAILGGADFPDLYRRIILFRLLHPGTTRNLTEVEQTRLRDIDPLTYAQLNRPRRVLMIQAARDDVIPAANAEKLWRALGRPPIRWLDTNHYGPVMIADAIREESFRYLVEAWGMPKERRQLPLVTPTLKLSLVSGLDAPLSFGLALQTVSFLQRPNHMSLLHFDVGLDTRGPFFGLAATVNAYMDVGYGRRFGRASWKPFVSLHLAL
jgi:dienelactone hydrolase